MYIRQRFRRHSDALQSEETTLAQVLLEVHTALQSMTKSSLVDFGLPSAPDNLHYLRQDTLQQDPAQRQQEVSDAIAKFNDATKSSVAYSPASPHTT